MRMQYYAGCYVLLALATVIAVATAIGLSIIVTR